MVSEKAVFAKTSPEKQHNKAIDVPVSNAIEAAEHIKAIHGVTPTLPVETIVRDGIVIHLHCKFENVQSMYTFKARGSEWFVYNLMKQYHEKRGMFKSSRDKPELVTASAGNHAQGVALAAKRYGLTATIFMPITTPDIKKQRVKDMGANIQLVGEIFDDALAAARKYKQQSRLRIFIPPYENPTVMEGQASIGVEILSQLCPIHPAYWRVTNYSWPVPDVIISGLGGGGLLSGIGAVVKDFNAKSGNTIKLIGVQTELSDPMYQSIKAGKLMQATLVDRKSIADGIAIKHTSERMRLTVKKYVDQVVSVSEENIIKGMAYLYQHPRLNGDVWDTNENYIPSIPYRKLPNNVQSLFHRRPLWKVEGAGAASYAAVVFGDKYGELDWKKLANGKKKLYVVAILTGANIGDETLLELIKDIKRPRDI
ncbi:MAG: pyridoxal-phosphate dependent enzyme [archaeon]